MDVWTYGLVDKRVWSLVSLEFYEIKLLKVPMKQPIETLVCMFVSSYFNNK